MKVMKINITSALHSRKESSAMPVPEYQVEGIAKNTMLTALTTMLFELQSGATHSDALGKAIIAGTNTLTTLLEQASLSGGD